MKLSDYDFTLPERLIAQTPLAERSASRLLHLQRASTAMTHEPFARLPQLLREGDLLVRNDTRVLSARLFGSKPSGGRVELLLVRSVDPQGLVWRCMSRSSKPLRPGALLDFPAGIQGEVVAAEDDGQKVVSFSCPGSFAAALESVGHMPLPPYIRRDDGLLDRERYQTVFASNPGAVAAPTAGLHFTAETFAGLEAQGIEVCDVTLHVGPGTFQPPRTDNLDEHRMHAEVYNVPAATAESVNSARAAGRRIVALGTTVTRTLEAAVDDQGRLQAGGGETALFIQPGFPFRLVDALFTNFHLPKSTLLVLVAAFAGRDFILQAYAEAVAHDYRFFSYGDCMLIE